MEIWKFYDITHSEHVVLQSNERGEASAACRAGASPAHRRVLDIACGKGEFLIRLAEAYGVRGLGVDLSPFFIAAAEKRLKASVERERNVHSSERC